MSERPTPETDAAVTTFTSISKLKNRFECSTGKVSADFARRLERERDEARELVKTYKDYAQLLGDEISDTAALVYVHGWRSKRHEQRKLLQDKIKQLEGEK